ncbi:MAG TPA: TIGR00730 family Rossman fold protein, partial [Phycisphaerae bacterium]|nr:TIGR00730 family Rossman fold protein [Phycisphaerae bacterium]
TRIIRHMKSICVFCGSSPGAKRVYHEAAVLLGREIGRRKWRLVYGGGSMGLMGVIANAALEAGAEVVGVITHSLDHKEKGHRGIKELLIVSSLHERKATMAQRADAFVALPGGFGTYDEFCEILAWSQLGIYNKPCCILNIDGFYDPLLAQFDRAVAEEFIHPKNRSRVLAARNVTELLDALAKNL